MFFLLAEQLLLLESVHVHRSEQFLNGRLPHTPCRTLPPHLTLHHTVCSNAVVLQYEVVLSVAVEVAVLVLSVAEYCLQSKHDCDKKLLHHPEYEPLSFP